MRCRPPCERRPDDTADAYGPFTNETLLGRALAGKRDKALIATKFGGAEFDDEGTMVGGPNGRPEYVRRSVERSLRRLGADYIDLLYQHRVDANVPVEETFGALCRRRQVRYLGISEAGPDTIRRAHATAPLSAVQTEYSLFTRHVETNGVLDTVRALGIGFVAYSPLGRGFLTGQVPSSDELAESDLRRILPRFQGENLTHNLGLLDRAKEIAAGLNVTPAQLALAWVLAQGDHVTAVPGTKRRRYLEENVGAAELHLDAATLEALDRTVPASSVAGDRLPEGGTAGIEA